MGNIPLAGNVPIFSIIGKCPMIEKATALRRMRIMPLKRPNAGGESCFTVFFLVMNWFLAIFSEKA